MSSPRRPGLNPDVEYIDGERGWTGDVPRMRLDIETMRCLGWAPEFESDESVRNAAEELAGEV